MNRTAWIVGGIILVVAIGGAIFFIHIENKPSQETERQTVTGSGSGNASVGANGAASIVTYSDSGFSPSPLTIQPGTTITWNNQSSHKLWVQETDTGGSSCQNKTSGSLSECADISKDGTYSYTFTSPGTYTYFNKENSNDNGTIIVTDAQAAGPINHSATPE